MNTVFPCRAAEEVVLHRPVPFFSVRCLVPHLLSLSRISGLRGAAGAVGPAAAACLRAAAGRLPALLGAPVRGDPGAAQGAPAPPGGHARGLCARHRQSGPAPGARHRPPGVPPGRLLPSAAPGRPSHAFVSGMQRPGTPRSLMGEVWSLAQSRSAGTAYLRVWFSTARAVLDPVVPSCKCKHTMVATGKPLLAQ